MEIEKMLKEEIETLDWEIRYLSQMTHIKCDETVKILKYRRDEKKRTLLSLKRKRKIKNVLNTKK